MPPAGFETAIPGAVIRIGSYFSIEMKKHCIGFLFYLAILISIYNKYDTAKYFDLNIKFKSLVLIS
jgi:hypothetical protein